MGGPVCAKNEFPAGDARPAAFTLVEVVLALGLFAFAVAGILGLVTAALDTSRQANDFSMVADLNGSLLADLRSRPYTAPAHDAVLFFGPEGNPVASAGAAHFSCRIREEAIPDRIRSVLPAAASAGVMRVLRLEWEWPVNSRERRVLKSSLFLPNPSPAPAP